MNDRGWPDVLDVVVGCLACQFDWQVYGIGIEFACIRRRSIGDTHEDEIIAT
jgi:hypothetical protein